MKWINLFFILLVFSCKNDTNVIEAQKKFQCNDSTINTCFYEKYLYIRRQFISSEEKDRINLIDTVFNYNRQFRPEFPYLWLWYSYTVSKHRGEPALALALDVPRTSSNVKYLFESYKQIIYKKINYSLYRKLDMERLVNDLLESYSEFNTKVNVKEIEKLTLKDDIRKYFTLIAYSNEVIERHGYPPFANFAYKSWTYSFWYRRYMEGNKEIVYEALKDIDEHYQKESSQNDKP